MKYNNFSVVTGGAGFIGSHLVGNLLNKDCNVLVIDDYSSGNLENLSDYNDYVSNGQLRIVEADILNLAKMIELCQGADFVYHLACRNVRLSLCQPTLVHDVNATGTLNMLKAAAKAKVKRFLYCSSSEVNGTADIVPMPEEYHFKPETIYGASKLTGEYYTDVFYRSGWLETSIVRPHNNYGPREHYKSYLGEVIPRFIIRALYGLPPQIYGDGKQTRDFTYVTETVDFITSIMHEPKCAGMTLNLCHGEEVSISQIATLVSELTQFSGGPEYLPGRPADVLRLFGDNTLLQQTLGRTPKINIREGLALTVDWFRKHVPPTQEIINSMDAKCWENLATEDWLKDIIGRKI